MKTIPLFLALFSISLSSLKTCSAQTPEWVSNLANGVFPGSSGTITHWEEKQMTWYNVNGQLDQADSITVNTLIIKKTDSSGYFFTGAIPVTNGTLNPVGARGIYAQSCEGQCGCQRCEFKKNTYGCDCLESVAQTGCNAWCKHTISSTK